MVISLESMERKRKEELSAVLAHSEHIPVRRLPHDPMWRAQLKQWLADKGVTYAELGKWVGGSQGTVSNILNQEVERSEYVERISVAVGIQLPTIARLEIAGRQLAESDEEAQSALIKLMVRAEQALEKRSRK